MARKSLGGDNEPMYTTKGYNNKTAQGADLIAMGHSLKGNLPNKKVPYGRRGSAANQKRMMDNEANGTAWKTGYKTGLPTKPVKPIKPPIVNTDSTIESAKRVAGELRKQALLQRKKNGVRKPPKNTLM